MRRLVLCCLLGLGANACAPEEPLVVAEPLEQPLCPGTVSSRQPAPEVSPQGLGQAASALVSDPSLQKVIVRFRKQTGVATAALSRAHEERLLSLGGRVKYNWPSLDALAVSLSPEAQAQLAQDPDVLSISPNHEVHALGLREANTQPARTGSASEYNWAVKMTQANEVWDPDGTGLLKDGAPNGEGITVCVVDSGIDPRHPELMAAYAGGRDFVDNDDDPQDKDGAGNWGGGHGTHVSGTIAAQLGSHGLVNPNDKTLSPEGMVGMVPGVRLLMARVLNTKGSGDASDVIAAVKWCREVGHAQVVSLSLGSFSRSDAEEEAFQELADNNVIVVAASGNSGGTDKGEEKVYPAGYPTVVAVGAVDKDAQHPEFSQGGDHLSLVAPGVNVYSTFPEGEAPFAELSAEGASYDSQALVYSAKAEYEGTLVNCGIGKGLRSCLEGTTCEGFVAYVDRGDIHFSEKVKNVLSQGARAVIVGNNKAEDDETLGFTLDADSASLPVTAVPTTLVPTFKALFGHKVHVGVRGADYTYETGTSMATPHVAGVAALVWSANRGLTAGRVQDILYKTARRLADPARPETAADLDPVFGWGLVQARPAVNMALDLKK